MLLSRRQGMRRRQHLATLHLLIVVAEDELDLRSQEMSEDLANTRALPTDGARCRGSWRGPQPGGVEHPPNPRGWLFGEVQAIPQIYPSSKNTRTLEDLEWFGPTERNTLRPLGVVLLLSL